MYLLLLLNWKLKRTAQPDIIYWVGGSPFLIRKIIKIRIDYNAASYSMIVYVRRYLL